MDLARVETRVDAAILRYGAQGRGVLVAIIDRGLDYTNNDFRNTDGTTRIAEMFDLTDNTGAKAANNPYGMGTIYTRAQINASLAKGGTPLVERDAVGHGTATTGIAVGNGFNSRDWKYRGVAPKATILVVKVVAGAAAHGDQPAEAPSDEIALLPTAFQYAHAKAKALGLPCVMLLNSGSTGAGPVDGTSKLDQQIDSMVGPGIPGMVFITGSSDEGGIAHAQTTVAQGQSVSLNITKQDANSLFFTLWYPQSDRYDVSIQTPAAGFGPYLSPATNAASDSQSGTGFAYIHYGAAVVPSGSANLREILIAFNGAPGNYTVTVRGAAASGGTFNAWLNTLNGQGFLTNFVVPGYTVWDLAAAKNNITPNCYVVRNRWADVQGIAHVTADHVGQLWAGSGVGPTLDGRLGIDVSAPGQDVFTSLAPNSTYILSAPSGQIQDGMGFYTLQNAVSASNPQVAGIVALIMEMNPTLDAAQIRIILRTTARSDAFTGQIPNTTWGYGKVDALAALSAAAALPGAKPYFSADQNSISIDYPLGSAAPAPAAVKLTSENGAGAFTVKSSASWLSVDLATGTAPASLSITANPAGLSAADYAGEVTITPNSGGVPQSIMVHLHVRTPGPLILSVVDGASFGPGFANGSWLTIRGYGLANTMRTWQLSDFNGNNLPTALDGVSVAVFGPNAYVYYISPTQINVLAPDNPLTNTRFAVVVNTNNQQSNTFIANTLERDPQFFTFDGHYIAAVHLDGTDVAPVGFFPGLNTTPAERGETVELFGTGCGATNPPLASGSIITTSAPVTGTATLTIGGEAAATSFVGVVSNGLCQINAIIPSDAAPGDAEVVLTLGTAASTWGTFLSIR